MTTTLTSDVFKAGLFELLEETFERSHGIFLDRNTSLFETLDTITAAEASRPVSATCASIAAQVAHVRFYIDTLLNFLTTGKNERVDWGEIWQTVEAVSPEEWEVSKGALRESHRRLLTMVRDYDAWDTDRAIGGAIGLVAHSAYHLGEIRQALCTVRQGP